MSDQNWKNNNPNYKNIRPQTPLSERVSTDPRAFDYTPEVPEGAPAGTVKPHQTKYQPANPNQATNGPKKVNKGGKKKK